MASIKPVVLCILDGWGLGEPSEHNGIYSAETPVVDRLWASAPHAPIGAAGEWIGLEPGHQGATEIGHYIMGAGRNVKLPQTMVKESVLSGDIKKNAVYREVLHKVRARGGKLHLFGLLSNAGVHSYDIACHMILEMAAAEGVKDVVVHVCTDGRDTNPQEIEVYLERLHEAIKKAGVGRIGTLMGRYWGMDRDHRWERVERAYRMLTQGEADFRAASAEEAVAMAYARGETDEFIQPTVIETKAASSRVEDGDAFFNFNFRADREIEITQAFVEDEFEGFARAVKPAIDYIAMMPYYEGLGCKTAFDYIPVPNALPEILSQNGIRQLRISETEKWIYLTKIFNCMREDAWPGEERVLIPSDKIATYDLQPKMQAMKIAERAAQSIREATHEVIIVNIANADMLGHTGIREAILEGVAEADAAVGVLEKAILETDGLLLITADHGHAELIYDVKQNKPHKAHTDALIPFIAVGRTASSFTVREGGSLKDIAATMCALLAIPVPPEMDSTTLLVAN